jgi:3-hydroxybutyryl-CoA dehydratase
VSVYLEEIEPGLEIRTARRTVTEADIVTFAGLGGDFNPLHTDEIFAREETPFRGRIAHGLLILAIADGLRNPFDDWAHLAWLDVQRKFVGPTYPGDTIQAVRRVESVRHSRSRPGTGIVEVTVEVVKQDGEVVQTGRDVLLVAARDQGAA